MTDGEEVINFLMVCRSAEDFFRATSHHYVYDRKFNNPSVIAPLMLSKLNKTKIFQLRFRSFISSSNRCDNFIVNVFDNDSEQELDIQPQQPITTFIHT
jgi:replication factor A1